MLYSCKVLFIKNLKILNQINLKNKVAPTASDLVYDIATYAFCSLKRIQFSTKRKERIITRMHEQF